MKKPQTLVLEKKTLPTSSRPCPHCGKPMKWSPHPRLMPAQPTIIRWYEDERGHATMPAKIGVGETGLILAGHAADDATERGLQVRYKGRWTPRERRGPWDVNKAMRGE